MEKQERENRINAIKNIIQATVQGEKIKIDLGVYDDIKDPPSIWDEIANMKEEDYDEDGNLKSNSIYDEEHDDDFGDYYDVLDNDDNGQQMMLFSEQIQSKIRQEATVEEVSDYIKINPGKAIDIDSIELWDCKETEGDLKYGNSSWETPDIVAYFDEEYIGFGEPEVDDIVEAILKKDISLEKLPEKLLFSLSFVHSYIEHASYRIARKTQQKGITPQDIEDASGNLKLGNFRNSIGLIKEIAKGEQEITNKDKDKDD